jgi:P27 family predicted phage terminase small subunit
MAQRGRKPKTDPGPVVGVEASEPPMPAFVKNDKVARAEWRRVVALLTGRRTLSAADAALVGAYCSAYSTVHRCRMELDGAESLTVVTAAGGVKAHPLVSVLSGAERSLATFADALGMSPTARARAAVIDPAGGDDLDEFLADGSA